MNKMETAKLVPAVIGQTLTFKGHLWTVIEARQTKKGFPFVVARDDSGRVKEFVAPTSARAEPSHFDIRRKEYDFAAAPVLDGLNCGYMAVSDPTKKLYTKAIDAAREAARIAYLAGNRSAFVGCVFVGDRPPGAMRGHAYVSYHPRFRKQF